MISLHHLLRNLTDFGADMMLKKLWNENIIRCWKIHFKHNQQAENMLFNEIYKMITPYLINLFCCIILYDEILFFILYFCKIYMRPFIIDKIKSRTELFASASQVLSSNNSENWIIKWYASYLQLLNCLLSKIT